MNKFLIKFNRTISYILIPLFITILITGYRSTGHFTFIGRAAANTLHIVWLNIAFLILFTSHSLIGIKLAMIRNKVKGRFLDALLIIIGILFVAGFSYFAFRSG